MSNYTLVDLREACKKYLATRPEHDFGFCYWALLDTKPGVSSDEVYSCVGTHFHEYRKRHPEIGTRSYVSISEGCVPERVAFVKWMLKRVKKILKEEKRPC